MKGLSSLKLDNPAKEIRRAFNLYIPAIRKIDQERLNFLRSKEMSDEAFNQELYMSSLNFWSDIVEIARSVDHSQKKPDKLNLIVGKLKLMNKGLPSFVFVPSNSKYLKHPFLIFEASANAIEW